MIFFHKFFLPLRNHGFVLMRRRLYNLFKHFLDSSNCSFKALQRNNYQNPRIMMDTNAVKDWKIFNSLDNYDFNFGNYGILILNRPISLSPEKISILWKKACWRITIDGGTDRWFDFVKKHSLSLPLPNYVTGDFDSIKPETLNYCKEHDEITVENTPDQDYTDFDKALNVLIKTCPLKLDCFIVILEHSGRLDQTFSNLNTLSQTPLHGFMVSDSDMTWLLRPGCHHIYIPDILLGQSEWCGILPFSSAAKVTTKGLKWNLDNHTIQFGGLLSSSNTYDGSSVVVIDTDATVIWTMGCGKQ